MKHLSLSGFEQWNFQCPDDAEEVGMEGRAGKRAQVGPLLSGIGGFLSRKEDMATSFSILAWEIQ